MNLSKFSIGNIQYLQKWHGWRLDCDAGRAIQLVSRLRAYGLEHPQVVAAPQLVDVPFAVAARHELGGDAGGLALVGPADHSAAMVEVRRQSHMIDPDAL